MHIDFSRLTQSPRFRADLPAHRLPTWLHFFPPFWIVAIVWFVARIPVLMVHQKQRQSALAAFARDNHFGYVGVGPGSGSASSLTSGATLQLPYEVVTISRVLDRLTGKLRDLPFEYVCATVKLKLASANQNGTGLPVGMSVFRLTLPEEVPRLYIEAKHGYHQGQKLPASRFARPMYYHLEGDFPSHYDVIGEKDEQLDIYMLLTPDVMSALVDNAFYDIWLHDKELLLIAYGTGRQQYFTQTPTAFQIASLLTNEIDRIARSLRHKEFVSRDKAKN